MANSTNTYNIGSTWLQVGSNVDSWYIQNDGDSDLLLKISNSEPSDVGNSLRLKPNSTTNSMILGGNVWAISMTGELIRATVVKGITVSGGGSGGGGSSIDRELVVSTYTCKTAFTGASVGDTITQTQIIDVTSEAYTVDVVWRNQTTGIDITTPNFANLSLVGVGTGLTDAQLRATPVVVSGPITATEMAATMSVLNAIPDAETGLEVATQWGGFAGVDTVGGDFVTNVAGLNGQSITVLSASPLTAGESSVVNYNKAVAQPCSMEFAGSFVRGLGTAFATASLFANDAGGPDPVPSPINIVSYYQSSAVAGAANTTTAGTVMHINLETAIPAVGSNAAVFIGDWVNITGLVDTRFNYQNACVNYISPDRKMIAVGFSDEVALPSIVFPASGVQTITLGTAKVNFYNNFSGARNAIGLRFTGSTATSAAIVSLFGGDDNQVSGTLLGDHRVTIGSTAPTYVAGALWGQYEIRATSRFRMEATPDVSLIMDKGEQTYTQWTPRDVPRTSVKPSTNALLYPRFRLYKPVNMSRPIAKIVKAEKLTATTTATITTDVAHGLVTGNYVTIKGIANQTNFAAFTVPAAVTVVDATTFTVVCGTAAIATSYGGVVVIANGGKDTPNNVVNTVQNVVSRVADGNNWLDVTGAATWAGLVNLGDYINLHGVRNTTNGGDVGVDGVWEVVHIATTVMTVKPVFDIAGTRLSPALGTLGSTACGGMVLLRHTLRAHDLSVNSWKDIKVSIDGQGTTRADKAVPIYSTGGSISATAGQGTAAAIGTGGAGAWVVRGAAHTTADIASAAITSTSIGSAIDITGNTGSMQINTDVTAVSGTSPRMFTRIQGSFDGTNFVNVYDVGVITTSTAKNNDSPVIPVEFKSIKYIRDVRGTTPSFTNSVNRVMRPLELSKRQRRLLDRVVGLTTTTASTEWLYVGGCTKAQLMSTAMSGQTVAAVVKVQLCQGDPAIAGNWYDIPSAPTLTTSATTFVVTAPFDIGNAKFARLVPTTAGTGIVADTYELALTAWE